MKETFAVPHRMLRQLTLAYYHIVHVITIMCIINLPVIEINSLSFPCSLVHCLKSQSDVTLFIP